MEVTLKLSLTNVNFIRDEITKRREFYREELQVIDQNLTAAARPSPKLVKERAQIKSLYDNAWAVLVELNSRS